MTHQLSDFDFTVYAKAYSENVNQLLQSINTALFPLVDEFVAGFYQDLAQHKSASEILDRLTVSEFDRLQAAQAEHLRELLCPEMTLDRHYHRALKVGYVHEMVGVNLPTMIEANHLYQNKLMAFLSSLSLDRKPKEVLEQAIKQRLLLDLEAQIQSHYRADQATSAFFERVDRITHNDITLPDFLNNVIQTVTDYQGIVVALFLRPDIHGQFQIEAIGEAKGYPYAENLLEKRISKFEVHAGNYTSQGPIARAWRSAQIETTASSYHASEIKSWRKISLELGLRSNVAIPLLDDSGKPFALFMLYSNWPGFFDTVSRKSMLKYLQQTLSHAVMHFETGGVIRVRERRAYCESLEQDKVRLHYQPIIDLNNGHLVYLEALARLEGPDHALILPGEFLPAFGKAELFSLFKSVLKQVALDHLSWKKNNFNVPVSINLPQEALIDDDYRDVIVDLIDRQLIHPQTIKLEILETQDPHDLQKRDQRIGEFKAMGLHLLQDDLGSGHSSLLRMEHVSFDAIKIDQGLVRSAIKDPQRALEFIYHLTRLAHGFGLPVTVEGLESEGLIEAASILGADYGQGYGIGMPMPADNILAWSEQYDHRITPQTPRTPLGALAGYLLWDQQLNALTQWPDLIEDFVQAPCLVQRYLDGKSGQPNQSLKRIQRMLASNHACALRGGRSIMYKRTKQALIGLLGKEWLHSSSKDPVVQGQ